MKKMLLKNTFNLLALALLLSSQAFAFDCKEVIGEHYLSVGDSDFQYHYTFEKDSKASLVIHFEEHDMQDNTIVSSESYNGKYEVKNDKLTLDIEVRDQKHKIVFKCEDRTQYMNARAFDQGLIPQERTPKNHSFSGVPLFKKGSKVIKAYLNKHKH